MARISDEVINQIKQSISLQRLVESRGIALKKHGQDLSGLSDSGHPPIKKYVFLGVQT